MQRAIATACAYAFSLLLPAIPALALEIPVSGLAGWTSLAYRNIPPNALGVSGDALSISVRSSASPIVYKLDAPVGVTGITVAARWSGELRIPEGAVQGEKGADDFVLKVGLVEEGEQTLSWLQRRIAADWIKQLFLLAPAGSGVERIYFLSTTQQRALLGSTRTHPLSDLLYESRIEYLDGPGEFQLSQDFAEPVRTLGLWLSADGDDTGSSFDLVIERITLHTDAAGARAAGRERPGG